MPRERPHITTDQILANKGRGRVTRSVWKTYHLVNNSNQAVKLTSKDGLSRLELKPYHTEIIDRETFLWLVGSYNLAGNEAVTVEGLEEFQEEEK